VAARSPPTLVGPATGSMYAWAMQCGALSEILDPASVWVTDAQSASLSIN